MAFPSLVAAGSRETRPLPRPASRLRFWADTSQVDRDLAAIIDRRVPRKMLAGHCLRASARWRTMLGPSIDDLDRELNVAGIEEPEITGLVAAGHRRHARVRAVGRRGEAEGRRRHVRGRRRRPRLPSGEHRAGPQMGRVGEHEGAAHVGVRQPEEARLKLLWDLSIPSERANGNGLQPLQVLPMRAGQGPRHAHPARFAVRELPARLADALLEAAGKPVEQLTEGEKGWCPASRSHLSRKARRDASPPQRQCPFSDVKLWL